AKQCGVRELAPAPPAAPQPSGASGGARQRTNDRGAGTLRRRERANEMAKKKLAAIVKIQIPAGQATPAPPVGTALGPHGINIMDFCKAYNAATENQRGMVIP